MSEDDIGYHEWTRRKVAEIEPGVACMSVAKSHLADMVWEFERVSAERDQLRAARERVLNVALTALDAPQYSIDPNYLLDMLALPDEVEADS